MKNSVSLPYHPYDKIAKVADLYNYAHDDQLYQQVKKKGDVLYLKCTIGICDRSAKMQNGVLSLGVS